MEKVIHKTKGLCTIWSEFYDYYVLVDSNGKKFQAQAHEFTRPIDVNATEVPNFSLLVLVNSWSYV